MKKIKPQGFAPSGSGKPKPKAPVEVDDTAHSASYAEVLGAVSEGRIEGPVNGLKSIYLNETPVENADGSRNFSGFTFDWRPGTQDQDRLPGFSDEITSETAVGVAVENPLPITRSLTNANLDGIRLRLGFVLQEYPENGGVLGLSVAFRVYVQEGAGAFVLRLDTTMSGRYSSLTEYEWYFPVNNLGGTVDTFAVRVERVTPQDDDTTRYQRVIQFQTFTEVIETKLRYPNTAVLGLRFDAAQFESVPAMAAELAGRTAPIPTNAVVAADRGLTYSGLWDGTFYEPAKACADPAWIIWDLLITNRYGLGRYLNASLLGKWSLYEISQYCNAMVSNGMGGTERRFQCNTLIEGKEEAYRVLEAIRSIFKGFSYWMQGAVYFAADMPGSAELQFTQADVENGMFSYSRTASRARHTIALVTWIDPSDFYRRTVETVEDVQGIAIYGPRELEISAFGCTSRGQARRAGLAALLSERLEMETVTFRARAIACYAKPGQIIKIADAKRAEIRNGGLVQSATAGAVTLDAPVSLAAGDSYTLTCLLPDGTIEERAVTTGAGTTSTLAVSPAYSLAPSPESNWILAASTTAPQLFRVLNRAPVPGAGEMLHEITALEYQGSKYAATETGLIVQPPPTRQTIPPVVNLPRQVSAAASPVVTQGIYSITLDVTWLYPLGSDGQRDQFISSYLVQRRRGLSGEWEDTRSTRALNFQYPGLPSGNYYARVAAIDIEGKASAWVESGAVSVAVTAKVVAMVPQVSVLAIASAVSAGQLNATAPSASFVGS